MSVYPNFFLEALGAWQNGWGGDAQRRRRLTAQLTEAIALSRDIPISAFTVSGLCYRKRFLIPNNPQNAGDFWPLFFDGEVVEGIASWSQNYDYVTTSFKKGKRPGAVATLFRTAPKQDEIILNVPALWRETEFLERVQEYRAAGRPFANALANFAYYQEEVILRTKLRIEEIVGFCDQVPSLEEICTKAGMTAEADEENIWQKMMEQNLVPTADFWITEDAATRAINAVGARFMSNLQARIRGCHEERG